MEKGRLTFAQSDELEQRIREERQAKREREDVEWESQLRLFERSSRIFDRYLKEYGKEQGCARDRRIQSFFGKVVPELGEEKVLVPPQKEYEEAFREDWQQITEVVERCKLLERFGDVCSYDFRSGSRFLIRNARLLAAQEEARFAPHPDEWIKLTGGRLPADALFLYDPLTEERLSIELLQKLQVPSFGGKKGESVRYILYQRAGELTRRDPTVQPGVPVSERQVNALAGPMLWYQWEQREERRVLVPVVYLPEAWRVGHRIRGGGSLILESSGQLKIQEKLHNTGFIEAKKLKIEAEEIHNERRPVKDQTAVKQHNFFGSREKLVQVERLEVGGEIRAEKMELNGRRVLKNSGGLLHSTESTSLKAGHLINEPQAVSCAAALQGKLSTAVLWSEGMPNRSGLLGRADQ